jgi:hypothetical protein
MGTSAVVRLLLSDRFGCAVSFRVETFNKSAHRKGAVGVEGCQLAPFGTLGFSRGFCQRVPTPPTVYPQHNNYTFVRINGIASGHRQPGSALTQPRGHFLARQSPEQYTTATTQEHRRTLADPSLSSAKYSRFGLELWSCKREIRYSILVGSDELLPVTSASLRTKRREPIGGRPLGARATSSEPTAFGCPLQFPRDVIRGTRN